MKTIRREKKTPHFYFKIYITTIKMHTLDTEI